YEAVESQEGDPGFGRHMLLILGHLILLYRYCPGIVKDENPGQETWGNNLDTPSRYHKLWKKSYAKHCTEHYD
ncbi:MAG: hypothetical protein KDJ99_26505, partial [Candidatus Competibacteraceae bacterium]|nr:hypothetical protein [Candidatus Competibacteraceae bacterium]